MEDQQLYNLDGPLNQQHFTVTKLQYKNSLHFSIIYHVFYTFILWRTTHFLGGPTVFLTYWSLDQAVILVKVVHWLWQCLRIYTGNPHSQHSVAYIIDFLGCYGLSLSGSAGTAVLSWLCSFLLQFFEASQVSWNARVFRGRQCVYNIRNSPHCRMQCCVDCKAYHTR